MVKKYFGSLLVTIICIGLTACGDVDKHPFKDLSDNFRSYVDKVIEDPSLIKDEGVFKSYKEKEMSLCKDLCGKCITVEIADGLGLEVKSQMGEIGEGQSRLDGDNISFPINFELKVTNADTAFENINDLMAVFYDDDMNVVNIEHPIEDEKPLKAETEIIDELDTIPSVPMDDVISGGASFESENPYKVGDVVKKGITVSIEGIEAQLFENVTKIVIKKYDYDEYNSFRKELREKVRNMNDELKSKVAR